MSIHIQFKNYFVPLLENFGVKPKPKPNSIKNPQSNAILERVDQVIGEGFDMYVDILRVGADQRC